MFCRPMAVMPVTVYELKFPITGFWCRTLSPDGVLHGLLYEYFLKFLTELK